MMDNIEKTTDYSQNRKEKTVHSPNLPEPIPTFLLIL